ncbi:hypothetical protein ROZALSC1DRAFT_26422 [Rozella allomycis CSF55]|uniref:p25-alpha domain-containing protein n=1 Tax=Rozella allomycis (strain CSF55) TaxID=988480 RepID=A0A075AMS4_ROZAC|nr:P25-alpha domain-containing protein [Rozella allomycis CSF55]RKP22178.1 hypothetical protein ROZALSC1DRAFT_26422 [Rozella allomycis CSF55]|eukprot:EPZ30999.1 P25-alpha domain-containing protein [Rozella allomycis CSF55]
MDRQLQSIFERFCSFGSGSMTNLSAPMPQMDGAKFAKFTRDTKIVDNKRINSTQVDIIFNKIKHKNERKIDYAQFRKGLQMLAQLKFPEKESSLAYNMLVDHVISQKGPSLAENVTKIDNSNIVNRMTNPKLYPEAHKQRYADANTKKLNNSSSHGNLNSMHNQQQNQHELKLSYSSSLTNINNVQQKNAAKNQNYKTAVKQGSSSNNAFASKQHKNNIAANAKVENQSANMMHQQKKNVAHSQHYNASFIFKELNNQLA